MLKNRAMSVSNVIYTIEETLDVTYIPETPVSSPVSSPIPTDIVDAIETKEEEEISFDMIYPAEPAFLQNMENDVKINIEERQTELYLKALKRWKDYKKH
jgi:hypothetical protein